METIFKRRSIRKYTSEEVTEDVVQKIITAGMAAPSAGNEQPWHFIVMRDRQLLDGVTKFHPYATMLEEVTVAIMVCGDLNLEKFPGFWVQDCAAATENMLLEITAEQLGSVWLGLFPFEERVQGAQALLKLPVHIIPFSIIPVGVPAEEKEPKDNVDLSRIHYNKW